MWGHFYHVTPVEIIGLVKRRKVKNKASQKRLHMAPGENLTVRRPSADKKSKLGIDIQFVAQDASLFR